MRDVHVTTSGTTAGRVRLSVVGSGRMAYLRAAAIDAAGAEIPHGYRGVIEGKELRRLSAALARRLSAASPRAKRGRG